MMEQVPMEEEGWRLRWHLLLIMLPNVHEEGLVRRPRLVDQLPKLNRQDLWQVVAESTRLAELVVVVVVKRRPWRI